MKKRFLEASAMLMMLLSISFSVQSCGLFDEDVPDTPAEPSTPSNPKDDEAPSLVGTWVLKSETWILHSDDAEDREDVDRGFSQITFKEDGTAEYQEEDPDEKRGYVKWAVDGDKLRIDLGESGPDDFLIGTFTLDGNTLTYSYHWEDYYGKWVDNTKTYNTVWEKK
ncbi:MAG: lipocalin family protein [Prevotella sp.]|nr:lipocalin family protein [Prevotella sp.]